LPSQSFAVIFHFRPNYDALDWTPVFASSAADPKVTDHPWLLGNYVDYGHNLEAAWMLADSVKELQSLGAIDSSKAAETLAVLQEIGQAAVSAGYDAEHGGM
jgi:hypothetical protein